MKRGAERWVGCILPCPSPYPTIRSLFSPHPPRPERHRSPPRPHFLSCVFRHQRHVVVARADRGPRPIHRHLLLLDKRQYAPTTARLRRGRRRVIYIRRARFGLVSSAFWSSNHASRSRSQSPGVTRTRDDRRGAASAGEVGGEGVTRTPCDDRRGAVCISTHDTTDVRSGNGPGQRTRTFQSHFTSTLLPQHTLRPYARSPPVPRNRNGTATRLVHRACA